MEAASRMVSGKVPNEERTFDDLIDALQSGDCFHVEGDRRMGRNSRRTRQRRPSRDSVSDGALAIDVVPNT